jgi:hypothetical protein
MRGPSQLSFYQATNCVDLDIGNRRALAAGTDQSEYPVDAKNAQTIGTIGYEFREDVAAE